MIKLFKSDAENGFSDRADRAIANVLFAIIILSGVFTTVLLFLLWLTG